MNIRIIGSGSYIPPHKITNADFADHLFLDENGQPFKQPASVIEKFKAITGIEERRYADADQIYADGAGAVVVEGSTTEQGLLSYESATYALEEAEYLNFGSSYQQEQDPDIRYIKMKGRKIYEFALSKVPLAMQACLQKADLDITAIKKILIHQANEKMDEAILMRFYALYDTVPPPDIMPMTIHTLGNSSVATIPTLYDLISRGQIDNQSLHEGDIILFASVGAGMNINAFVYRV